MLECKQSTEEIRFKNVSDNLTSLLTCMEWCRDAMVVEMRECYPTARVCRKAYSDL